MCYSLSLVPTSVCCKREDDSSATLHVANVGDARVVVSHKQKAMRLSRDHRAEDPSEIQRIQRCGGLVFKSRVLGILAVSRSLGDHGLKEFVSGKPHTTSFHGATAGDFVVIACDGLWDVMADEEVVAFVNNVASKESAAQLLIDEAIRRKSADNITVVVSWI